MSKKLHYFDINGIAEYIRYMLHYSGQKFEDVRYDHKNWPIKEIKDSLPFGQFPLYEEGDRKLNQSFAIARYIASQTGLLPSDPWEQAVLDAVVLTLFDFRLKISPVVTEKDEAARQKIISDFLTESVDYYLSRFDKQLKANNGFFGKKLSWADFALIGMIDSVNQFLNSEMEKNYPSIHVLHKHIRSLPGVKEYIANKKPVTI